MKRFFVFVMLCIFLFTFALFNSFYHDQVMFPDASVQIFAAVVEDNIPDSTLIKNGNGYVILCQAKNEKEIINSVSEIAGKTYILDGDLDYYNTVLKRLNIKYIEKTKTSSVGFSNLFNTSVFYDGKKVNVQTYFNNNKIYIGTPLILGSY